jgi:hypothetical protein
MVKMASEAGKLSEVKKDIRGLRGDSKKAWAKLGSKYPDLKRNLSKMGIAI